MAFRIDNFIGNINKYGTLQTNKFEVEIPIPTFLREAASYPPPSDLLHMRAEKIRVPGLVLDNIETRRYGIGPNYKTATNVRFEPVNISFIETNNAKIFEIFNDWIRVGTFDFSGTGGGVSAPPSFLTEYKEKYIVDIMIKVYNNSGVNSTNTTTTGTQPIKRIKLIEAFPISIGDNDLSWGDNNTLYKMNISFAYNYHQLLT